jgi:2-oxoglutarate ferredoxin oxidoreductase subunit alpha
VRVREQKVEKIANHIPLQKIEAGYDEGDLLILGWGSTFGVCESVTRRLLETGYRVGHAHLRYLRPFPRNLGELLSRFDKILIPEINTGQLASVIRDKFLLPVAQFNKIQGTPIADEELYDFAVSLF